MAITPSFRTELDVHMLFHSVMIARNIHKTATHSWYKAEVPSNQDVMCLVVEGHKPPTSPQNKNDYKVARTNDMECLTWPALVIHILLTGMIFR